MFPSVDAIVTDFPDFDSPKSLDRSTLIKRKHPFFVISTFFIINYSKNMNINSFPRIVKVKIPITAFITKTRLI